MNDKTIVAKERVTVDVRYVRGRAKRKCSRDDGIQLVAGWTTDIAGKRGKEEEGKGKDGQQNGDAGILFTCTSDSHEG